MKIEKQFDIDEIQANYCLDTQAMLDHNELLYTTFVDILLSTSKLAEASENFEFA